MVMLLYSLDNKALQCWKICCIFSYSTGSSAQVIVYDLKHAKKGRAGSLLCCVEVTTGAVPGMWSAACLVHPTAHFSAA